MNKRLNRRRRASPKNGAARAAKAGPRRASKSASPRSSKSAARSPAKSTKKAPARILNPSTVAPDARSRPIEIVRAVRAHKYTVGQTVHYTASGFGRFGVSGSYKIVKLLPSDGDDHQYRIKSATESFERVAKESQLDQER
jgi:hypothetical protein